MGRHPRVSPVEKEGRGRAAFLRGREFRAEHLLGLAGLLRGDVAAVEHLDVAAALVGRRAEERGLAAARRPVEQRAARRVHADAAEEPRRVEGHLEDLLELVDVGRAAADVAVARQRRARDLGVVGRLGDERARRADDGLGERPALVVEAQARDAPRDVPGLAVELQGRREGVAELDGPVRAGEVRREALVEDERVGAVVVRADVVAERRGQRAPLRGDDDRARGDELDAVERRGRREERAVLRDGRRRDDVARRGHGRGRHARHGRGPPRAVDAHDVAGLDAELGHERRGHEDRRRVEVAVDGHGPGAERELARRKVRRRRARLARGRRRRLLELLLLLLRRRLDDDLLLALLALLALRRRRPAARDAQPPREGTERRGARRERRRRAPGAGSADRGGRADRYDAHTRRHVLAGLDVKQGRDRSMFNPGRAASQERPATSRACARRSTARGRSTCTRGQPCTTCPAWCTPWTCAAPARRRRATGTTRLRGLGVDNARCATQRLDESQVDGGRPQDVTQIDRKDVGCHNIRYRYNLLSKKRRKRK